MSVEEDNGKINIREKKKKFHMIENDEQELEQKIRKHRMRNLRKTLIILGILCAILFGLYIFFEMKTFTDYRVVRETERSDTAATKFENFQGNILKYSNDGAFYTDLTDHMIWNQTYEMQNPTLDTCEGYMTIYDKGGTNLYILDKTGLQGNIKTTMPIFQVCVASQGTVAVLMEAEGVSHLQMYDKSGTLLASGELHQENSGYPLAIALSYDAKKLAVSMLAINEGKAETTIAFYNFGSVGQNEIDNIVASYIYKDQIFPELEFLSNNRMIALGDSEIVSYEGTQKPKLVQTIELKKEIKSVFYNEEYIGIVSNKGENNSTRHIEVYDWKGKSILSKNVKMDYTNIEFLENNEICITNDTECRIYSLYGVERFHYTFEKELYKVFSGVTQMDYTFILDGTTEKVKIK